MAIDFPTAPTTGQQYAFGGVTYTFTSQGVWAPTSSSAVPATPFDALAYNGMQINGSMEVNQELGAGNQTSSSGKSICDGWTIFRNGSMVFTGGSSMVAPIVSGITGAMFVVITTAQSSLGSGDYLLIQQNIEGYRTGRLAWGTVNAQSITIGFWSQHHRTGVYSVAVVNGASNRTYCATYTHNASDVSQYNVITIPGDTTGAWNKDNTTGISLNFTIASGTTYTAPSANSWLAGVYQAAPGQVNGVAATSDVFRITGVTVLPGIELPSAARSPLIMRPYDQELPICMRYYQKLENVVVETPAVFQTYILSIPMRSAPTITGGGVGFNVSINNDGIIINVYQTTRSFQTLVFDARL